MELPLPIYLKPAMFTLQKLLHSSIFHWNRLSYYGQGSITSILLQDQKQSIKLLGAKVFCFGFFYLL